METWALRAGCVDADQFLNCFIGAVVVSSCRFGRTVGSVRVPSNSDSSALIGAIKSDSIKLHSCRPLAPGLDGSAEQRW